MEAPAAWGEFHEIAHLFCVASCRHYRFMTDTTDDFDIRQLVRPAIFFAANRNLFASYDAFRKQLERRRWNGLAASGAVVDTRLGLMLQPHRYSLWLMQPRKCHVPRGNFECRAARG
jgi:hypothetical protein